MTNPPESPYGPADSTPQQPPETPDSAPPPESTPPPGPTPSPEPPSNPTEQYPTEQLPPEFPTEQLPPPYPPQTPPPSYPTNYPTQQYPPQQYPPQPPPPQQPPTYNAAQFYPPQPQQPVPYGYTLAGQAPPKRTNGAGLAALILGICAIVIAFIPFVNFGAFLVGVAGVILGIVGLALVDRPRRMAAWGLILSALSLVIAFVMVFVYTFGFIFAVSGAVDEAARNSPQPTDVSEQPAPSPTDTVVDVHPLGTVVDLTDESGAPVYAATISASVLDATDLVSAIELNPDAPAGMQWAMVTVDLTSLADSTVAPAVEVTVEYVTPDGDSYTRFDAFALAPEPTLDVLFELEPDESATGNVVIAIPTDDPSGGYWALKYGSSFGGGERFYFEVE